MEVAGLVIGVAGITFQFFQVGKEGFKIIDNAKGLTKDGNFLQTLIRVERQRYENWADQAGLHLANPTLFEQRNTDQFTTVAIALDILAHICDLLTAEDKLRSKYGLKISSQLTAADNTAHQMHNLSLANGAATLWSDEERQKRQANLLEFQRRLSTLKKVKWVLHDKRRFEELITKLRLLNDGLRDILPPERKAVYDRSLLINQPGDPSLLGLLASAEFEHYVGQTYAQAARIKKIVAERSRNSGGRASAELKEAEVLNRADVKVNDIHASSSLGIFRGSQNVLVEFKRIQEPEKKKRDLLLERVKDLVVLLQVTPKPTNYRVLDCKGYYMPDDKDDGVCAIVYDLPPPLRNVTIPSYHNLYSLLRKVGDSTVPTTFPLGDRFRLASLLASSLAELHAAGWLHHNITSSNVICFSSGTATSLTKCYFSGFGFARFDDPSEVSEVSARSGDNNYRHPLYQVPVESRSKYRRSYELYSLGVLLIEIALWRRIQCVRPPNADAVAFTTHLQNSVAPIVGFYMGEDYQSAVLNCLDTERLGVGDDEGKRLTEAFSDKVVAALERCRA